MAYFERRGRKWRAQVMAGGRRVSKTFWTRAEAEAWAVAYQRRTEGTAPPGTTVNDLFDRYKKEVSSKKRGGRWEGYRLACFGAEIGSISLDRLSSEHLSTLRDKRAKTVQNGTILREFNLLNSVLNKGIKWGWLRENPLKKVDRPPKPEPRTRRISDKEAEAIYHACGFTDEPPRTIQARVGVAFALGIANAMRAGEMVNLRWKDIVGKVAHVDGKTGKRAVPLTPEAISLLDRLRPVTEAGPESSVLGITSAQLDALFRKARDRAMVKEMTFHDSRAEALTRLSRKVDVLTLARISGHRDIGLLHRVYYRETAEDIAERL